MNESQRSTARHTIERTFRTVIDRDVTGVTAEHLAERGDVTPSGAPAYLSARAAHDVATQLLRQQFIFDWEEVVYVYDRPGGQERYLTAKVRLAAALARSHLTRSPDVDLALKVSLDALNAHWIAWAGHQATLQDDLAPAVVEDGVTS